MDAQRRVPWRIVSSTYPVDSPYLRLRCDVIELPDGRIIHDYYVRETRGFTVIFALTADDRVVLVRQYKHGAEREVLELPAGMVDEGESPETCAVRELAEETGYAGDAPEHVRTFLADPTSSNGRFDVYLVRNAEPRVAQRFDPTEDIAVEFAALREVLSLARDGVIRTGSHVACIYATLDYLGLLAPR
ncbi:MAG: NUDIX hydrolase [Candidatus Velthaea sp.]